MRFLNTRDPANNIYIGIPSCLLGVDPALEAATDRYQRLIEQTFWSCNEGFEFCQACEELARRGYNIDLITILLGPGGVGLSLFTAALAARYGPINHRYFDPNIFYQDEELRKTIQHLFGGFIFF